MTILIPASAQAFTFRMPTGFPGTISRNVGGTTVESNVIDAGNPPLFFGQAVVYDTTADAMRPPTGTDTVIDGITVRAFPTEGNFPASPTVDPFGTANVPLTGTVDVLKRGYVSVTLSGTATAIRYNPVYVWIAASSGTHVNGGFEAAATAGSTLLLPNTYFMGPPDASGVTEIGYNI
jgi:hypothetical protein